MQFVRILRSCGRSTGSENSVMQAAPYVYYFIEDEINVIYEGDIEVRPGRFISAGPGGERPPLILSLPAAVDAPHLYLRCQLQSAGLAHKITRLITLSGMP